MLLHENDDFTLVRDGRFLRATLKHPHRVLSNCYVNGGLREDLTHICNHHSSEDAGTDQIAVAAPLARGNRDWERHWAGGHNSLCELLGRATRDAVRRRLLLQNGACAELRRNLCDAIGRHGCNEEPLCRCAREELTSEEAEFFERNLLRVIHDLQSAAAAYCLAEGIDLATAGVLHQEVAREAILNQASLLAASVAVQPDRFAEFRRELQTRQGHDPGSLAALAVIRGFTAKWS